MIEKNSGKIFQFKLEHNVGFGFCEFVDLTDMSPFDGKLLYIFNLITNNDTDKFNVEEIKKHGLLFGPVPLLTPPNSKGKGAWKFLGKTRNIISDTPVFKSLRGNTTEKDWSQLKPWYPVYDFTTPGQICDYQKIRHLELPVLYGKEDVIIRITMQQLLIKGERVNSFYNLSDFHYRNIYIRTVNTSFSLKEATILLTEIN